MGLGWVGRSWCGGVAGGLGGFVGAGLVCVAGGHSMTPWRVTHHILSLGAVRRKSTPGIVKETQRIRAGRSSFSYAPRVNRSWNVKALDPGGICYDRAGVLSMRDSVVGVLARPGSHFFNLWV